MNSKNWPKKLKKWFRSTVIGILAFPSIISGTITEEARDWVRQVYWCYRDRKYSFRQIRWAVRRGFLPEDVEPLGVNRENCKEMVSRREYAFLRPINGIYSKWISDLVTIHAVFKPFRHLMPEFYYQIGKRDGKTQVISLTKATAKAKMDDVIRLLEEKQRLKLKSSSRDDVWTISYRKNRYYFDNRRVEEDELRTSIRKLPGFVVVTEDVAASRNFVGGRLRLLVLNSRGDNPCISDAHIRFRRVKSQHTNEDVRGVDGKTLYLCVDTATGALSPAACSADRALINPTTGSGIPNRIPCWDEISRAVDQICRFVPQLEFFGVDIVLTDDGFRIMQMHHHPPYSSQVPFGPETTAYLKDKIRQKKQQTGGVKAKLQRAGSRIKLSVRATFAAIMFPKGLYPYLSVRWFQDQWKDFRTNRDTTLKEKLWAVRHGFISYRLHQYGITPDNYLNYISDLEYKWLRHINSKYRHWMEDKITVKYICSDYNQCFPEYYFHIIQRNGANRILPMMDCPAGYTNSYEDILRLAREKGALALKPDEGSHGNGFFKLAYENGQYFLNHREATAQDVLDILQNEDNQYLVTEYIVMHDEIKRIYAGAVNTIRMIVFKKDGRKPVIGNAYMRFGSARTGAVDNMGAGGMYAKVDVDTGRFYDAKIIEANEIKPCLYHPDTNVMIDGYLPNWEKIKKDVLDVAKNIPQLEYFGFDLALTPDGLKFPEINRFPDYPAIEKYSPATIDYLLYKLEMKKRRFGYDTSRGHSVIKLLKRD